MHFDSEAPDIYVVENDARAKDVDFSLCTEDSTRTLTVINTATGTLKVSIASDDEALFFLGTKTIAQAHPPTFIAIEADGTCHYFDLQGRMLSGKPDKGLCIMNGKKVVK